MALANYLTRRSFVLKTLLLLLGAFYVAAGAVPKSNDYWVITNISTAFAVNPLHFMVGVKGIAFPPTFYALQGRGCGFGSHIFRYNLTVNYNVTVTTANPSSLVQASPGIFPLWGMIPILAALFLFVGVHTGSYGISGLRLFASGLSHSHRL